MLQPQSISGWTHDAFGGRSGLDDRLAELRDATARALGTEPPELRQLYRVHPRSLLMAVGALVGDRGAVQPGRRPGGVLGTRCATRTGGTSRSRSCSACCTDVAFGITFLGNVPIRIPVWPSIELQSAMSFSNLAVPVAADTAIQVRFLQKQGLDLPSAVATGGVLSSVSEIIVQIALFFVALWLAPDSIDFGRIDTEQIAVDRADRRVRRAASRSRSSSASAGSGTVVLPPVVRATRTVWDAVKTPSRIALLVVRQHRGPVPLRRLAARLPARVRGERRTSGRCSR